MSKWLRTTTKYTNQETFSTGTHIWGENNNDSREYGLPKVTCGSGGQPACTTNRMRFMGIDRDLVNAASDLQESALVQKCKDFGVCGIQDFTVTGSYPNRRRVDRVQNASIHTIYDLQVCGSMGYVMESYCVLDKRVAILPYFLAMDVEGASTCSFVRQITRPDFFTNSGGLILYPHYQVEEARSILNNILLNIVYMDARDTDWWGLYASIHTCTESIQLWLEKQRILQHYPELDPCSNKANTASAQHYLCDAASRTQGLYFFYKYAAYEIPLYWWLKYMLQGHLTPKSPQTPTQNNQWQIPVDAFEMRSGGAYTKERVKESTINDIWVRANTRFVFDMFTIARGVAQAISLSAGPAMPRQYGLKCPREFKLGRRTYEPETQEKCSDFEKFAFSATRQGGAALAGSSMTDQMTLPRVTSSENEACTSFLSPHSMNANNFNDFTTLATGGDYGLLRELLAPFVHAESLTWVRYDPANKSVAFKDFPVANVPGIPLLTIKLDNLCNANVNVQQQTITKILSESEANVCRPTAVKVEAKSGSDRDPCIFNRNHILSMDLESRLLGARDDTQDATYTVTSAAGVVKRSLCNNDDAFDMNLRGSSTPRARDGMSCSIRLMQADAGENVSPDECQRSTDRIVNSKCRFFEPVSIRDNSRLELGYSLSTLPEEANTCPYTGDKPYDWFFKSLNARANLHKFQQEDMYMSVASAFMASNPSIPVRRKTSGICLRADSGCVTNHAKHIENPVNDIHARIEYNAYGQATVGLLEQESRSREITNSLFGKVPPTYNLDWWYNKNIPDISGGLSRPWSDGPYQHKSKCHITKIETPPGVKLSAYTLNDQLVGSGLSFSHLLFSDRVLFKRGHRYMFGHDSFAPVSSQDGRYSEQQATVAAPAWSFCPGSAPADYGMMHHFKAVTLNQNSLTRLSFSPYKTTFLGTGKDIEKDNIIPDEFKTPLIPGGSILSVGGGFETCSMPSVEAPTWGVFDLAICYEQNVYEKPNARPWWSQTICDMTTGFLDNSVNLGLLRDVLHFDVSPFRDIMWLFANTVPNSSLYTYLVESLKKTIVEETASNIATGMFGSRTKVKVEKMVHEFKEKTLLKTCKGLNQLLDPNKVLGQFGGGYVTDYQYLTYTKKKRECDLQTGIVWDGVNEPGMVSLKMQEKVHLYTPYLDRIKKLGLYILEMAQGNLAIPAKHASEANPVPFRLIPCIPGFKHMPRDRDYIANAFNTMDKTQQRQHECRVDQSYVYTKPTQWAELDGNPRTMVVPCRPGSTDARCKPALVLSPGDSAGPGTWSSAAGACSFSLELDDGLRCVSSKDIPKQNSITEWSQQICPDRNTDTMSFYPVVGLHSVIVPENNARGQTDSIWKCALCTRYNTETCTVAPVDAVESQINAHCLGCGIYEQDNQDVFGPHTDAFKIQLKSQSEDVVSNMDAAMHAMSNGTLGSMLVTVEEEQMVVVYLKDTGAELHPNILNGFRYFGMTTPRGEYDGCNPSYASEESSSASCTFSGFDGSFAAASSAAIDIDIRAACSEDVLSIDDSGVGACVKAQTKNLERLSSFVNNVLLDEYGLPVPNIPRNAKKTYDLSLDAGGDWTDGVLPFFAVKERPISSPHTGRYLSHLLNLEMRCRETYSNKQNAADRTCIKSGGDAGIRVVNPWVGGNYSFLSAMGIGLMQESARSVWMGFDMCNTHDVHHIDNLHVCFPRECLVEGIETSNISICKNIPPDFNIRVNKEIPAADILVAPVFSSQTVYIPRPVGDLCSISFPDAQKEFSSLQRCKHMQAPLGYDSIAARRIPPASKMYGPRSLQGRAYADTLIFGPYQELHKSFWTGRPANLASVDSVSLLEYTLLAVARDQPSPGQIGIRVDSQGYMYLDKLHVRPLGAPMLGRYSKNWLSDVQADITGDIQTLAQNPLYTSGESRGRQQHWVCPYVHAALLGGSRAFRQQYPSVVLLTPDPLQMSIRYPGHGLAGVHPLVRTVPLMDAAVLHTYNQVGIHAFFHAQRCAMLDISAFVRKAVIRTRDAIEKGTGLYSQSYPCNNVSAMSDIDVPDWPLVNMTTRSGEEMTHPTHKTRAYDTGDRIGQFVVWVRSDGRIRPQPYLRNASSPEKSTIDPGGDCHKGPLVKMTSAELAQLIKYDACRVVASNRTHRSVSCESVADTSGVPVPTRLFVFDTTRPAFTNSSFRVNFETNKNCKAQKKVHNLDTYLYQTHKDSTTRTPVLAEVSLSRRHRISPMWGMLLRASNTTLYEHLSELSVEQLWARTHAARAENPRWRVLGRKAAAPGASASLFECAGVEMPRVNESEWEVTRKGSFCVQSISHIQDVNPGCIESRGKAFDLCSLDVFQSLCYQLSEARREIAEINARANGAVSEVATLYTPSVYVPSSSGFVWDRIRKTYSDLGLHFGMCTGEEDKDRYYGDAVALQASCPAFRLFNWIERIEQIKKSLVEIIRSFIAAIRFALNLLLLFVFEVSKQKNLAGVYASEVSDSFVAFIISIGNLLKTIMRLVIDLLRGTPFFEYIEFLMSMYCWVINLIIDIISFFNPSAADAKIACSDFNHEPPAKVSNTDKSSLVASQCFIQSADMPSSIFEGVSEAYRCHANSFCADGLVSNALAKRCYACGDGAFASIYGCDLTTKQCVCGYVEKVPIVFSTCLLTFLFV